MKVKMVLLVMIAILFVGCSTKESDRASILESRFEKDTVRFYETIFPIRDGMLVKNFYRNHYEKVRDYMVSNEEEVKIITELVLETSWTSHKSSDIRDWAFDIKEKYREKTGQPFGDKSLDGEEGEGHGDKVRESMIGDGSAIETQKKLIHHLSSEKLKFFKLSLQYSCNKGSEKVDKVIYCVAEDKAKVYDIFSEDDLAKTYSIYKVEQPKEVGLLK